MTPTQQQGYDDQTAGMLNAALSEADTPQGREYRDGARQARRDSEDPWNCTNCGWSGPKESLETSGTGIKDGCPRCHAFATSPRMRESYARIRQEADAANDSERAARESNTRSTGSKPSFPDSNGPGGAFSEPQPGARKPRKAKPVDDAQASLF